MTRLVRLNEVQYAETEHQIAGLVAQGFVPVPLEVAEVNASEVPKGKESKDPKTGKGKSKNLAEGDAEDNPSPEGDEQH